MARIEIKFNHIGSFTAPEWAQVLRQSRLIDPDNVEVAQKPNKKRLGEGSTFVRAQAEAGVGLKNPELLALASAIQNVVRDATVYVGEDYFPAKEIF